MRFFHFLKKKKFYLHLALAITATFLIVWLVFMVLKIYTRHGDSFAIPDFTGMTMEEIDEKGLNEEFRFVVQDSVYDRHNDKGSIVQQNPPPHAKVKENRKVYVTIVAKLPEKVSMPNLVDLSLRQALGTIHSAGLQTDYLDYTPHFAENAILGQFYMEEEIEPGTLIDKGARIELLIGSGYSDTKVPVPFLVGKKQTEAHRLLHLASFNIGNEYFLDGRDTISARVYKTEPSWENDTLISHGEPIDIWYRSTELFDFEEYIQSLQPDTIAADTTSVNKDAGLMDEY
ncbi:MAG: PASTA domain-containing protein [Bacteroidales bacterium]|nr:PASTA domain-containing protein [Bacteroidales bacterium]MCF8352687.1 PASTA domain-containing protein [Bacteroidales bacterium]MCF8376621.1 PASTA domain-containing protein [Bacteroidales bacterium]MCF8400657.1 PASTA domain-containing protein [Bacteroidales bacterium]